MPEVTWGEETPQPPARSHPASCLFVRVQMSLSSDQGESRALEKRRLLKLVQVAGAGKTNAWPPRGCRVVCAGQVIKASQSQRGRCRSLWPTLSEVDFVGVTVGMLLNQRAQVKGC